MLKNSSFVAMEFLYLTFLTQESCKNKWAASWQKQQTECAPRSDWASDQTGQIGHLPSLIRVFAVRMKKAWVLSYPFRAQWRLWSDWAGAQADLSLHWAHTHFVGFVMRQLRWACSYEKTTYCIDKDAQNALEYRKQVVHLTDRHFAHLMDGYAPLRYLL